MEGRPILYTIEFFYCQFAIANPLDRLQLGQHIEGFRRVNADSRPLRQKGGGKGFVFLEGIKWR
jgi:hypothetical protein